MTPYNCSERIHVPMRPLLLPVLFKHLGQESSICVLTRPHSCQPNRKAPLLPRNFSRLIGSGWSSPTNSNRFSKATTIAVSNHGSGAALSALTSSLFGL